MKKFAYFLFILLGLVASAAFQPEYVASAGCSSLYGTYGAGVECPPEVRILLDKKVKNPSNGSYVDNLGTGDYKFAAGDTVVYQLMVENTGNRDLENVTVSDVLPDLVRFVSGPGTYNGDTRTVAFTISKLNAGEKRYFDITVKVVDMASLPKDKSLFCVINSAKAKVGDNEDSDTAQVCIEKKVLGAPELPKAGPADTAFALAGFVTMFIIGRKLAKLNA